MILRKAKAAYEFSESKKNHLLFMDDLKFHSQSEKGYDSLVQTVCVFSEDIGMEFEYIRRIRKVLKSKLNGGNLVQGVNT